jgi:hypothetical protein
MSSIIASCTRPVIARVLERRDGRRTDRPASVSVLLGGLLLLLWGYFTYVDWPVAWPAPIRPIVKAIGWIWMAMD